jgi:hypothetical protein
MGIMSLKKGIAIAKKLSLLTLDHKVIQWTIIKPCPIDNFICEMNALLYVIILFYISLMNELYTIFVGSLTIYFKIYFLQFSEKQVFYDFNIMIIVFYTSIFVLYLFYFSLCFNLTSSLHTRRLYRII